MLTGRVGRERGARRREASEVMLDEKEAVQNVQAFVDRRRRVRLGRVLRVRRRRRVGKQTAPRFSGDVPSGALRLVPSGRGERHSRTHATRRARAAAFSARRAVAFDSRAVALDESARAGAVCPRVRGANRTRRRAQSFLRGIARSCPRRGTARGGDVGAATVVLSGRNVRLFRAASEGRERHATPHARREHEEYAGDENRATHQLENSPRLSDQLSLAVNVPRTLRAASNARHPATHGATVSREEKPPFRAASVFDDQLAPHHVHAAVEGVSARAFGREVDARRLEGGQRATDPEVAEDDLLGA